MLELYSLQHILSILVFLGIPIILIFLFQNKLMDSKIEPIIRYIIIGIVILFELRHLYYKIITYNFTGIIIPDYCFFALLLVTITLINKNTKVFTLAYFAILGPILSLLVPEVHNNPFHINYIHYFLNHSYSIFGIIYAYLILGLRVDTNFIKKTYIIYLLAALLTMILTYIGVLFNFEPFTRNNFWFMLELPIGNFPIVTVNIINIIINNIIWVLVIAGLMKIEELIITKMQNKENN